MIEIGDRVFFKSDVEGTGYVVDIIRKRNGFSGYHTTYLIANKRRDASPWHPMARYSYDHMCNVVYCEEYQVDAI